MCLNIETFLVERLCPVHAVVSEQDGLALLAPLCWDMPFALSHAIRDGPVSLASKVGRRGMSDIHMCACAHTDTNSFAELLHCARLSLETEEPTRGCNGVQQQGDVRHQREGGTGGGRGRAEEGKGRRQ